MNIKSYFPAQTKAIRHLKETALAGQIEVGFLLDRDTGEQLDYQEAPPSAPDEITFEVDLAESTNVAVLHNHRNDMPPGADDWQNFLHQPALQEMIVVTPRHEHRIEKPAGWNLPSGEAPKLTFLRFQAMLERARRAVGHTQGFQHLSESAQNTLLSETNAQMARYYGVDARQEELT